MGVVRMAVALGALTMSVPLMAQDSRSRVDQSRVESGREARPRDSRDNVKDKSRAKDQGNGTGYSRNEIKTEGRSYPRNNPRSDDRGAREVRRVDPRVDPRGDVRVESRRRADERLDVRMGRRDDRYDRRDERYDRRATYHFNDRDFRQRDVLAITAWFRGSRGALVYGSRDQYVRRDRYDVRPGFFLSSMLFAHLEILPYDLDLELGLLPWYLERRIYGRSVLVIDVRTRLVVDVYDIDW